MDDALDTFNSQISQLVTDNRRLRVKSAEDDETIRQLTEKYDAITSGINDMVEDHRARERELAFRADKAEIRERKMKSLVTQAADMILQAMRADIGDNTPDVMPTVSLPQLEDHRLPETPFN